VLRRVGGFSERDRLGEDGHLWARIALRYPIGYDVRVLATYHSEAAGRSFAQAGANPPYPPLVVRVRELLATEQMHPTLKKDVERYTDHILLQHAYWLLSLGAHDSLMTFLKAEQFQHPRYQVEAAALRIALPFVPGRLIQALKVRTSRAGLYVRQMKITRALAGEQDSVSVSFYRPKHHESGV